MFMNSFHKPVISLAIEVSHVLYRFIFFIWLLPLKSYLITEITDFSRFSRYYRKKRENLRFGESLASLIMVRNVWHCVDAFYKCGSIGDIEV